MCCLVASVAHADPLFSDNFADNARKWQVDEAWKFTDGELRCRGAAGQVAAIGQAAPLLGDFRAVLRARPLSMSATGGFGFLYRFDPKGRNGYFMMAGPSGGYGFGRVEGGEFEMKAHGANAAFAGLEAKTLQIDVRGDMHSLRCDGVLIDVWRDDSWKRGSFGLVVSDDAQVGFQSLSIEELAPITPTLPTPAAGKPRSDDTLGPMPPAPEETAFVRLDEVDVGRLRAWRRRFNLSAAALGDAPLPAEPDAADLAVLAWLRLRQSVGNAVPAQWLADLLKDSAMVGAGAKGPGAEAAVTFALQLDAAPAAGDVLSSSEELLAALDWYFRLRAHAAAKWGDAPQGPLNVDSALEVRLGADLQRVGAGANLAARQAAWKELCGKVREMATAAAKRAGADQH
jgi:hypothetical protein